MGLFQTLRDADQPIFDVTTLDDRIGRSLTSRRVPLQLIGLFAGVALVLAAMLSPPGGTIGAGKR